MLIFYINLEPRHMTVDAHGLRDYLHRIKDDWNYITPLDFYNKYYFDKKGLLLD